MTPRDLAIWSALYAAAWFHAPMLTVGAVTDVERASIAAITADRALEALRAIRPEGALEEVVARMPASGSLF